MITFKLYCLTSQAKIWKPTVQRGLLLSRVQGFTNGILRKPFPANARLHSQTQQQQHPQ